MSSSEDVTSLSSPQEVQSQITRLFTSKADTHIAHINRILSTASGIDTTLLLIGYTLTLLQSQLTKVLDLNLRALASRVARNASKSLLPGETVVAVMPASPALQRMAVMQAMAKKFAGMCSDVRTFMRLWGLLGIWGWAKGIWLDPPKDEVLKAVAWAQITVNTLYLIYEHPSYLASKGVLKGWSAEKITRWSCRSSHGFTAHVMLDYMRLWRVRQLRQREQANQALIEEKEEKVERKQQEAMWWKELYVNIAYTPLVVHWSLPDGLVSDTTVGLLGTWVGILGFREVWRQTA